MVCSSLVGDMKNWSLSLFDVEDTSLFRSLQTALRDCYVKLGKLSCRQKTDSKFPADAGYEADKATVKVAVPRNMKIKPLRKTGIERKARTWRLRLQTADDKFFHKNFSGFSTSKYIKCMISSPVRYTKMLHGCTG